MSGLPVPAAREQLQELLSILRELGNAGPRDQSFKQWRQVTLTLLQRIWPGEPTRAAIFRRIQFSAPAARADTATIREYFERGCSEASAYLEGLALELESGVALQPPPTIGPVAADAPAPSALESIPPAASFPEPAGGPVSRLADPHAPAIPEPDWSPMDVNFRPTVPFEPAGPFAPEPAHDETHEVDAPAPPPPPGFTPEPRTKQRQRGRLKDMLGFGDEPPGLGPKPAPAPSAPAPIGPPVPIQPPASAAPLPISAGPWSGYDPPADEPAPDAAAEHAGEAELEETLLLHRALPTQASREVLSMAGLVAELGVPAQRRAIVRAALIDLGRQMESPPVHWTAIRQALAFMLDYPQIARRVLPLLMPYLEEAA